MTEVARSTPASGSRSGGEQTTATAHAGSLGDHERQEQRLRSGVLWTVLLIGFGILLVVAVLGIGPVVHRAASASPFWAALALVLELASCLSFVSIFGAIFDRTPRRLASRVAWSEMAFGAVLPAGGAGGVAAGGWLLVRKGQPIGEVIRRSGILFLYTSAVNVAVLCLAAGAYVVEPGSGGHGVALGVVPAAGGLLVAAVVAVLPRVVRHRPRSPRRVGRWVRATAEVVEQTRAASRGVGWRAVAAWGYLLFDIAVLWACFHAFGESPAIPALVLGYQIGYLANALPIPGGVAVLDGGIIGALVLYGSPVGATGAAVLLYHAFALWVPTLIGTVQFGRLRGVARIRPQLGDEIGGSRPLAGSLTDERVHRRRAACPNGQNSYAAAPHLTTGAEPPTVS